MDREESIKLLKGRREGVVEWNRRREAGETIPDLSKVSLRGANLVGADLGRANFRGANLVGAKLSKSDLSRADLTGATCGYTTFGDLDLSNVIGLASIRHLGPSTVGI